MHGFKGEVVLSPEVMGRVPTDCLKWDLGRVILARDVGARYVPTPQHVVEAMLEMAQVTAQDVVYDLGCGDGRFAVTAASRYGARAVGLDIDRWCIDESQENAVKAGVQDQVEFRQQDALQVDLSPATVVTLYMPVLWNLQIRPKLRRELRPGTRIVAYMYDFANWLPDETRYVTDQYGRQSPIYLWRVADEQDPAQSSAQ